MSYEGLVEEEAMISDISVFQHLYQRLMCLMEPTSHGFNEITSTNEKTLAKTKVSRGKSSKACVAKAAGWTLEKAKDSPTQEDHINKAQ